jgi:hypothetical protein
MPTSLLINETTKASQLGGGGTALSTLPKQPFGMAVIRTPASSAQAKATQNQPNSTFESQFLSSSQIPASQAPPPPAPVYHPSHPHNKNYDIGKTVNSIVDNWEEELAKHMTRRRPSGQFESCNV